MDDAEELCSGGRGGQGSSESEEDECAKASHSSREEGAGAVAVVLTPRLRLGLAQEFAGGDDDTRCLARAMHFVRLDFSALTQSAPVLPTLQSEERALFNWSEALDDDEACRALLEDLRTSKAARERLLATGPHGDVFAILGASLLKDEAAEDSEPKRAPRPPSPSAHGSDAVPGLAVAKLRLSTLAAHSRAVGDRREGSARKRSPEECQRLDRVAAVLLVLVVQRGGRGLLTDERIPWLALLKYFHETPSAPEAAWASWARERVAGVAMLVSMLAPSQGQARNECDHRIVRDVPSAEHLGAGRHGVVQTVHGCEDEAMKRYEIKPRHVRKELIPRIFNEICALRLLTEAQAPAQRHVVPLRRFGRLSAERSDIFIVMDKASCSLQAWRSGLAPGEILESETWMTTLARVYYRVADALAFAAEHGVTHYDVRMDNILLVPHSSGAGLDPVLADFGEAHCAPPPPRHAAGGEPAEELASDRCPIDDMQYETRGTECIMAPEMLTVCEPAQAHQRANHDRRQSFRFGTSTPADVWALGCLLFEIATGDFLYQEALDGWATFFARLTRQREADALPLLPETARGRFVQSCCACHVVESTACEDETRDVHVAKHALETETTTSSAGKDRFGAESIRESGDPAKDDGASQRAESMLEALMLRALEPDPRRRPTAAAMREAAAAWLGISHMDCAAIAP